MASLYIVPTKLSGLCIFCEDPKQRFSFPFIYILRLLHIVGFVVLFCGKEHTTPSLEKQSLHGERFTPEQAGASRIRM